MNSFLTAGVSGCVLAPPDRFSADLGLADSAEEEAPQDEFARSRTSGWKLRLVADGESLLESAGYVGRDAPALPQIRWDELRLLVHENAMALGALGFEVDGDDRLAVATYGAFMAGLREMGASYLEEPRTFFSFESQPLRDSSDVVSVFLRTHLGFSRRSWSARVVFKPDGRFRQLLVYLTQERLALWGRRRFWEGGDFYEFRYHARSREPQAGFMITDTGR